MPQSTWTDQVRLTFVELFVAGSFWWAVKNSANRVLKTQSLSYYFQTRFLIVKLLCAQFGCLHWSLGRANWRSVVRRLSRSIVQSYLSLSAVTWQTWSGFRKNSRYTAHYCWLHQFFLCQCYFFLVDLWFDFGPLAVASCYRKLFGICRHHSRIQTQCWPHRSLLGRYQFIFRLELSTKKKSYFRRFGLRARLLNWFANFA